MDWGQDDRVFRSVLVPIHRAGWPFIAAALAVAILLGLLWEPLFWLGLLAVAFCTYFFRNPAAGDADANGSGDCPGGRPRADDRESGAAAGTGDGGRTAHADLDLPQRLQRSHQQGAGGRQDFGVGLSTGQVPSMQRWTRLPSTMNGCR